MTRVLARAAALGALLLVSACSGNVDFSVTKHFDVTATGGTDYTSTQHVDLATDAGDGWKHRSKVKSLELVGLDATMTANLTGIATTGSGSIVLKRAGLLDQVVGTWTNHAIPAAAPDSINATLNKAGVDLIMNALKGDGQFDVIFTGRTADTIHFTADVTLHLKMGYKAP